jgi:serine/threonine-protein kinase
MPDREQVVLNERYELERRVGRGGMAEVFLARDRLLDRPVAIKILFPEFATDPSFVARFRREAQSAANLNHPNIVAVYDWGKERGTYYIVMEYVDGRTVSDILRADRTIAPDRAAGIAADVAGALDFAHRNGVVHRDVKPGNVLITTPGEVKVADFGIARAMAANSEENLTQTGSVMGTATYFSPEQALGRPVDPRSDLYSLGVVLYEMSAGKPPFQADSPVATAYKHVQEPLPPLRDAVPDVPEGYEAITVKALAKEADQRYQAAGELRADLLRFRGGNPVGAAGVLAPPLPRPPTAATNAATAAVLRSADATSVTPAVDPDDGPKRRTGWFFVATAVLLAVLAGLLYLFADLVGVFDDDAEQVGPVDQVEEVAQVAVVEVVGQEEAAAIAALTDQGFEVAEPTREPSSQPEGRVIGQDPAAGTEVDEGSTVAITVSTGPEDAFLPNVIGGDLDEATFEIRGAGFTGDITTEQRVSDAEPDSVVGQEPPAGTHPVDQDVLLLLAVPPETTTTTAAPTTTTEPPPETTTTTEPPPETTTTTEPPPETTTTTEPPETTTTTEPPETTTTTEPPETTTTTEPPETTTTTEPPETTTTTEPPETTTTTEPPETTTTQAP